MKKFIAVTTMLILILTLAGCGKEKTASQEKSARTPEGYTTIEEGGLNFRMPDYFGEPEMTGNIRNYYAERGDGLSVFQIYSSDGTLSDENFEDESRTVYDSYVSGMKSSDSITDFQDGQSEDVTLNNGLRCRRFTYSFKVSDIQCSSVLTMISNSGANKVIMASITQSEQSEYDYIDVYTEMMDTCEIIGGESDSSAVGDALKDGSSGSENADQKDDSSDAGSDAEADSGLISPEFKKTMDDYEAWFDHYCEVMKKYKENPSDLELISEMTELLSEETEMLDQMDKMDQSEMSNAELAYYLEVTARIQRKLAEVAY